MLELHEIAGPLGADLIGHSAGKGALVLSTIFATRAEALEARDFAESIGSDRFVIVLLHGTGYYLRPAA